MSLRVAVVRLMSRIPTLGLGASGKACQMSKWPMPTYAFNKSLLHTSVPKCHGDGGDDHGPEVVDVTFIDKTGKETQVQSRVGERLLYLAHRKGIDMEGACEASLACTTCHCYIDTEEHFDILPEATETEEDLLDMAPFLDTNSRLGCQIFLTEDLSGMRIRLPRATKNFYVDGHKPQPH